MSGFRRFQVVAAPKGVLDLGVASLPSISVSSANVSSNLSAGFHLCLLAFMM